MKIKIILLSSIFSLSFFTTSIAMDIAKMPIKSKKEAAGLFNAVDDAIKRGNIAQAQGMLSEFKQRTKLVSDEKVKRASESYIVHLEDTIFLKTINLSSDPATLYDKAIALIGRGNNGMASVIIQHLEKMQRSQPNNQYLALMIGKLWDEYNAETEAGE